MVYNPNLGRAIRPLLKIWLLYIICARFGITPLHIAASVGHTMCIEELVRWGADMNAQESWGQTPLIIATLKGRVHCTKALIHLGASTEPKDYHHGNTALHSACNSKYEELVLALCDASADLMIANNTGHSPLGVALSNKFYHLVPLLLEYGARLNDADRQHLSQKLQHYIDNITGMCVVSSCTSHTTHPQTHNAYKVVHRYTFWSQRSNPASSL